MSRINVPKARLGGGSGRPGGLGGIVGGGPGTVSSYNPATGTTQFPGAVSASGDGGIQGGFIGTWDDEASLPATATPGSLATTRDGASYVFAAET